MGFTLSHFISQIHPRDLFRLLAIGMCHFLPVNHFVMACLLGPKFKIQHWTLTKRLEKKLDDNYTRILRAILNKSWHQLYSHLPPITKTFQVKQTRHTGHCWRSRDELISDVLLWTPTYGRAKAGRPART